MFKKILSILLYSLPIIFFVICYFLLVTSGEDIFQGANSHPDIFGDAIAAFNHSARLADMYAWASINFFDYTFKFGPDTIFRLIDVLLAFFTFYFATYLALGRKPKLQLKDAAVFSGIFLAVFLTSYGTTLYGGFSKIHNYLIISIVCLGFFLVYLKDILRQQLPEKWWFTLVMLTFGFIFGLTSSVTAVAFLLTAFVYMLYVHCTKQKISIKKLLLSWRGASLLGIILALFCIYVLGPGLADYDTNPVYQAVGDYVPLRALFSDFGGSLIKIIRHIGFNFGRFIAPFLVLSAPIFVYALILKSKRKLHFPKFTRAEKNLLVAGVFFVVLHLLALSQIYYFTRMVLPVYFVGLAVFFYYVTHFLSINTNKKKYRLIPLALIEIILMLIIISIRSVFSVSYIQQVSPILEDIRTSSQDTYCVTPDQVKSFNLPYIYLGQEDMLVDWAMPQTIYGKTVDFCK